MKRRLDRGYKIIPEVNIRLITGHVIKRINKQKEGKKKKIYRKKHVEIKRIPFYSY